jgi:hypothetical protein
MKQKLFFLMLMLFMLGAASVQAQVTIGADAPPHSSAVLDLQSDNLGFKLPTIELGNVSVFQLSGTATNADGIMVYNSSNATTGGSGKGIYVWEGKWIFAGKSAPVEVPVTKIRITSPGGVNAVNSGSTLQLTAAVEPVTASNQALNWTIVYNSATTAGSATIDGTGKITAVKPGTVVARATATDGSGVYRNFEFSVASTSAAESITITSVSGVSIVEAGGTLQLEAAVEPVSAYQSVTWSVDAGSTDYASVNLNSGLVVAIAPGTARIWAKSFDTTVSSYIDIEVTDMIPVETGTIMDGKYETYNFNGTTWMVTNSQEGNWSYDCFNGDANKPGYYYSKVNAPSACPEGWTLPSLFQATELLNYVNGAASPGEKVLWTSAGCKIGHVLNGNFADYGVIVFFWLDDVKRLGSYEESLSIGDWDPNRLSAVRCVLLP